MAEPFKNLINREGVAAMRRQLRRAWAGFDGARFEALALDGLEALELKARVQHLGAALEATLPEDFDAACRVIEASLVPVRGDEELGELRAGEQGLAGWPVWPLTEFVARRGLDHPERALRCLHALTQRFTAEWAVRPFIVAHSELAFATLARWTNDASPHVRRLASEGSRPRLPWGLQPKKIRVGDSLALTLALHSSAKRAQKLVIDYAVHHVKANGERSPKVFKGWAIELAAGESRTLAKQHSMRTVTTRRYHAGRHAIDLRINGEIVAEAEFDLKL